MIKKFIELLKLTPSGGNSQPWLFSISHEGKNIYLEVSLQQPSSLSYTDPFAFGSLIGLGMMSFSINYLAASFGFYLESSQEILNKQPSLSKVIFKLKQLANFELDSKRVIIFTNRFTDRNLYKSIPIEMSAKKNLLERYPEIKIFNSEKEKKSIISLFNKLSLIRFQNEKLFFEMLNEITIKNESHGIPIKNLGLNFPLQLLISFIKKFPIVIPYNLPHKWPIYQTVDKPLLSAPEVWCLNENGVQTKDWINLGKKFMDIWLSLTEKNIHLQPFGSTLIIANYFFEKNYFHFSKKHLRIIDSCDLFQSNNNSIDLKNACLFFRIGYSEQNYLATPRKNLAITDIPRTLTANLFL